ncbi:hypothetical protein AwDysgo_01420 [Bacteroidales bacterium]|nr:hypothetical protein AwDysgo_01420 [Bacteroidales bacterium]
MGVITEKGVLVLPSYKNDASSANLADYGYSANNGKFSLRDFTILSNKGNNFRKLLSK